MRYRSLTEKDARAIVGWAYPEPYDAYDADRDDPDALARLLRHEHAYHAILTEEGELVGYFCLGQEARIPGGSYPPQEGTVDLGLSMRPDFTGQGRGAEYVADVVAFVAHRWSPLHIRASVAAWNKRALAVCHKLGFRPVAAFGGFRRHAGRHYVVLVADSPARTGAEPGSVG